MHAFIFSSMQWYIPPSPSQPPSNSLFVSLPLFVFLPNPRCSELAPAFKLLLARPTQLMLMGAETYPTARPVPPSTTATSTGRGAKASSGTGTVTGAGTGGSAAGVDDVSYGGYSRDHRELAVEGPTDMGVLVYQMVQQQTQLK